MSDVASLGATPGLTFYQGNSNYPGPSSNVFVASAATDAAVRAAGNAAVAAGGGTVVMPAGTITINSALPLASGVSYVGAGNPFSDFADNVVSSSGGTILIAGSTGAYDCFDYNNTDNVSQWASITAMAATAAYGCSFNNFAMQNFAYGMKFGGMFNCGIMGLRIDNVCAVGCTQWGFWLENCQRSMIGSIQAFGCRVGHIEIAGSGGTIWNFGNSTYTHLFAQGTSASTLTARGIIIEARGTASQLNDNVFTHIQCNSNPNSIYSLSVTPTNGSANLPVTDLTKFAIGQPVYWGATANGFTFHYPYFVVAMSGSSGAGTIQLATSEGGTAIVASGATPETLNTYGGSDLRIGGLTGTGGVAYATTPQVTWSRFYHIDVEGTTTINLVVQNCYNCDIGVGLTSTAGLVAVALTSLTSNTNRLDLRNQINALFVNSDAKFQRIDGLVPQSVIGPNGANFYGAGVMQSASSGLQINMGYYNQTSVNGDIWFGNNTYHTINLGRPLSVLSSQVATGATLADTNGQAITLITTSTGTVTLPTIVSTNVGIEITISNPQSGTWTVATGASQNIIGGGSSATTFSITTLTTNKFMACSNAGTFYWAVK